MHQKLGQIFFLQQEAGAFGNNIGTEPQEPHPNWEICVLYITENIYPQSNTSGSFLQSCINFVEERLKLSHFEGSIIL